MHGHVIFLDIDGVLAPIVSHLQYSDVDPTCMELLNGLVERSGAAVVVSSSWRFGKSVAEMQEILTSYGFRGSIVGHTPTESPGLTRGEEIAAWLAENAVGDYVILDDHADMGPLIKRLVRTQAAFGLRSTDVDRALQILSIEAVRGPATTE